VAESAILPWIIERVNKMEPPPVPVEGAGAPGRIEELTMLKRRAGRAYLAGALEDDDFEEEVRRIDAELAAMTTSDRLERLGPVNWDSDPRDINELLRALLVCVQLDETMRPAGEPEWRVDWRPSAMP